MTRFAPIAFKSSMVLSQPRMLPSRTGTCCKNTKSPANRVPLVSSDREVAVTVRCTPRFQCKTSVPQIESHFAFNRQCRRDDFDLIKQASHAAAKRIEIVWPALRERPWQVDVTDKDRARCECCIAEHVIRMSVGIDDVFDGLMRHVTDGGQELAPLPHAAAGVNDRDRVVTDHKTDVGDRALVLRSH